MKAKRAWLAGFLFAPLVLAGCWDRREINDVAFVMATGFDKVGDNYRVSIQVPLPSQLGGIGGSGGGGGTSGEKSWYVESMTGKTVREANEKQQSSLSRQLYYAHRRVLLIGEEAAREGVKQYMDIIARIPQNRLGTFVMITKGETRNVLNTEQSIEQFPAEMMRELAQNSMRKPRTAKHFIETLLSDGIDPIAPAFEVAKTQSGSGKEKTTIKLSGMAVFKEGKLAGILNEDDSKGMLVVMNQALQPLYVLPAPKGKGEISVLLQNVDTDIHPEFQGGKLKMRLKIRGRGSVLENSSDYDMTAQSNLEALEMQLDLQMQKTILHTIDLLRKEYQSDPIGFGDTVYREFPDQWKKLRQDWQSHYEAMSVEVISQIHIVHTGSINLPFGYKEGEIKR
ncbi:Ger(x)C family spore germination protein [Tumebacillus flagellatus]|uniref:Uncharacterized protein n=1 Tax=Tumebacillus flagellatus TaxID=1157490 RepID=A0A074LKF2_9BACL|nr:Ger(x)C family spore germination protein [Tumebacillus flagellatus]KEO82596.1 hypothetical protein EL26_14520 [Tumebacillus flagellatus]